MASARPDGTARPDVGVSLPVSAVHVLRNAQLAVHLLDPVQDAARQGIRFCAGGYVWQVDCARVGPLLSGPEGPAELPNPFNGHGLPESFRDRTRDGRSLTWDRGRGLAPGVGILHRDGDGRVQLAEPCTWTRSSSREQVEFATEHGDGERAYALTRTLQLVGRDLSSATCFSNRGRHRLSLQWFAHPFFALDGSGRFDVSMPEGTSLPDNPGFALRDRRLAPHQPFRGRDEGHFDLLQLPPGLALKVQITHPRISGITFSTSFAPDECPIWANGHTFSIEPYQTLVLEPGETRSWTLRYSFGGPAGTVPTA